MRDGVSRALLLAFAASILLHVALFVVLPRVRELSAPVPPESQPLIAHLVEEPPAAPPAEKPAAPPKPKPAPPKPRPAPPKPRPAPPPEPAPAPAPVPAPELNPSPLGAPTPVPEPAAPAAPPPPAVAAAPPAATVAPGPPAPPALDTAAVARFRSGVAREAVRYKIYPRVAVDNGWEGDVLVRMTIGPDGRIAALRVTRGSGYEVLDRQALEMFRRAKPEVPVPASLRGRSFDLDLLAVYRLSGN